MPYTWNFHCTVAGVKHKHVKRAALDIQHVLKRAEIMSMEWTLLSQTIGVDDDAVSYAVRLTIEFEVDIRLDQPVFEAINRNSVVFLRDIIKADPTQAVAPFKRGAPYHSSFDHPADGCTPLLYAFRVASYAPCGEEFIGILLEAGAVCSLTPLQFNTLPLRVQAVIHRHWSLKCYRNAFVVASCCKTMRQHRDVLRLVAKMVHAERERY